MPHQFTKFSLEGFMEGEAVKAPMREAFSCGQHHWERFLPLIILLNKGWSWSRVACARAVRVQVIFQFLGSYRLIGACVHDVRSLLGNA